LGILATTTKKKMKNENETLKKCAAFISNTGSIYKKTYSTDEGLLNAIEKVARTQGFINPADIHTRHPASSLDFADLTKTLVILTKKEN
tara:strand:+ start:63 stop:329 length:267 start_codon:yes stop_codon:yes gene_type:complete